MNSEAASINSSSIAQQSQITPIKFTGTAREFFGIWIANILLSVLTLGIYSAWAKVRTKKYFNTHTIISGACFDYHAKPLSILKGRVLGVLLYILYGAVSKYSLTIALVFLSVIFLSLPWIIVQSMKFNSRNTSYRGVRFNFQGGLAEAYKIFLLLTLLFIFTLGLIVPYAIFRFYKFSINNTRYGTASFSTAALPGKFYLICLQVLGLFVAFIITMFLIFMAAEKIIDGASPFSLIPFLPFFLIFFVLFVPNAFVKTKIGNVVYNTTSIENFRFISTMRVRDIIWIYFSNSVAIVFTFGLLIPWTKIRLARYRAEHLVIVGDTDFNHFIGQKIEAMSAAGQEIGDIFDVDIAVI